MKKVDKTDPDYTVYALKGKDGRAYIGITTDAEKREKQHRSNKEKKEFFGIVRQPMHPGSAITKEFADFEFVVLAKDVDYDEACRLEKYWIDKGIKAGCNMCNRDAGGVNKGSFFGKRDSVNNLRYNLQKFFPLCEHKLPWPDGFIAKEVWDAFDKEVADEWFASQEREDAIAAYMHRVKSSPFDGLSELNARKCIDDYNSMINSPEYCEAFDRFVGFI